MASNDRRIVLLGKVGAGKSATGNTILMRKRFPVGTKTNEFSLRYAFNKTREKTYEVLDTPGIGPENEEILEKGLAVQRAILNNAPNPHVFLLVFDPDDCTDAVKLVNRLQGWFGFPVIEHMILVFTKEKGFGKERGFIEFLDVAERLDLVKMFRNRTIAIENHGDGRSRFQKELLNMIETTSSNGKSFFHLVPRPWHHFNKVKNEKPIREIPTVHDSNPNYNHGTGKCGETEGEIFTHHYNQGAKPKVRSSVETLPTAVAIPSKGSSKIERDRKPLMMKDVRRTAECVYEAGLCIRNMKDAPVTSLAKLALVASDEENVEAVRNVVNSEEVQLMVEKTASFIEQAATAFGKFVQDTAEEFERQRRRKEMEIAYKPRQY